MARSKKCSKCDRDLALAKFPADRRTSDNLSTVCIGCKEYADADGKLETRDLARVELMSEGGPYFGKGSPPEGDFFTREDLEAIAAANRDLAGEVKPPNKLGHSKEQILLAQSGLAPVDQGEYPAAGWLDGGTFDVVEGEDGKAKLVADVKKVPKKLGDLFEAGAWSRKSVELSRVTSQSLGGKVYDRVVTGLAWLGAKAPAIRTLNDALAWYAEGEPDEAAAMLSRDEVPEEIEQTVDFATGVVWQPEGGIFAKMKRVEEALNPGTSGDTPMEITYWVQDLTSDAALVTRGDTTWVVGWKEENGRVQVDPASEWQVAEQAWVAKASDEFSERARVTATSADTTGVSTETKTPETSTLTDDQVASFAAGFGIEEADAEKRREAVLAKFAEFAPQQTPPQPPPNPSPDTTPTPAPNPTPTPPSVSLSEEEVAELRMKAERGNAAYEAARVEKRNTLIESHVKRGALDPAKVDEWKTFYDANEEMAVTMLEALPVNQDLLSVYGSDETGEDEVGGSSYAEDFKMRHGIEAVI